MSFCLSVCYYVFCHHAYRGNKRARDGRADRHTYKPSTAPRVKIALDYLIRSPWGLKKSQRRGCINSRMLSTCVASPCQTLRELVVWRPRYLRPSPSISGVTHAQFAEGLHSQHQVYRSKLFVSCHLIDLSHSGLTREQLIKVFHHLIVSSTFTCYGVLSPQCTGCHGGLKESI